jgi:hypothetical protein
MGGTVAGLEAVRFKSPWPWHPGELGYWVQVGGIGGTVAGLDAVRLKSPWPWHPGELGYWVQVGGMGGTVAGLEAERVVLGTFAGNWGAATRLAYAILTLPTKIAAMAAKRNLHIFVLM